MDKRIFIYTVETDPRQVAGSAEVTYDNETVFLADDHLSEEDLRYLINNHLEVPFYKNTSNNTYHNNIKVTEIFAKIRSEIRKTISKLEEGKAIFIKCPDNYKKTFPDGLIFEKLTVEDAEIILEKEAASREHSLHEWSIDRMIGRGMVAEFLKTY